MPEIHRSTLYVIPADAISLPFAQRRGRVRSTQGMPENHQHSPITATPPPTTTRPRVRSPHVIPADAGNQRKTKHAISTQKHPIISLFPNLHPNSNPPSLKLNT